MDFSKHFYKDAKVCKSPPHGCFSMLNTEITLW